MVTVERYSDEHREEWDRFVTKARNGVFLFHRDYMEYHQHRFTDHSLLFRANGKLVGLLPASVHEDQLTSHGGLTFGGVISDRRMSVALMLELFAAKTDYLRAAGIRRLVYKPVPPIYHTAPAEEDLYALFRRGARLYRRDVSATIRMDERLPLAKGRKSSLNVAGRHDLVVERSTDFHRFMRLEAEVLARKYDTAPVHSGDEMALLAGRFPDNIKLFTVSLEGELLAGVIVYESSQVAHAQYIAASDDGKQMCALDLLFDHLLGGCYAEKTYFDFGISTEEGGVVLNEGLAAYKESYGARATVYDFYELDVPE